MVYGIGNRMVKFLVFIANFLIFVFGGLIFGFSLWANLDDQFSRHFQDLARQAKVDGTFVDELSQYQASLWVLVAVGALLLLVGFLGCCGAACESLICLTMFFVIVAILSLIELFTLVFLFTNRGELLQSLHKILVESSKTESGVRNLLPIEKTLRCCGATIETQSLYIDQCTGELKGAADCYTVLSSKLESMDDVIIGIGVVLLIIQAFSLIFSCVLCRAFRERESPYYA
jgi:hypothetical protein